MDLVAVIITSLLILCFLIAIGACVMLVRNELVYKFRIDVLNKDLGLYNKLPSYETLMWNFKPLKYKTYFTEEEIKLLTKD